MLYPARWWQLWKPVEIGAEFDKRLFCGIALLLLLFVIDHILR